MLALKHTGISSDSFCPLCNSDEESSTHLFLLCPFARACWHGSTLAIHSSDFNNISIQQWLTCLMVKYKRKEENNMAYLQAIFTTLWSMWNHRNKVIHQGINPNPFEVVLTAQSLSCRYRETFNSHTQDSRNATRPNAEQQLHDNNTQQDCAS